jgi:hypothetical protein
MRSCYHERKDTDEVVVGNGILLKWRVHERWEYGDIADYECVEE